MVEPNDSKETQIQNNSSNTKNSVSSNISTLKQIPFEFNDFLIDPSLLSINKIIGKGGQAVVYNGFYNNTEVVIKKFEKQDINLKEIMAYSKLKHDAMVKFHGYYHDEDESVNLVLDYFEGVNLGDAIPGNIFNNNQKFEIIKKITDFLIYLRENHAIHRDIKPQNIKVKLINDNEILVKVLDFGIATISEKTIHEVTGDLYTLSYAPPEIFEIDFLEKMQISYKYDIWSFGLVISYLISGIYPWKKSDSKPIRFFNLVVEQHLMKKDEFIIPDEIQGNWRLLIKYMTSVDSKNRINPQTVKDLLDCVENNKDIANVIIGSNNYN